MHKNENTVKKGMEEEGKINQTWECELPIGHNLLMDWGQPVMDRVRIDQYGLNLA